MSFEFSAQAVSEMREIARRVLREQVPNQDSAGRGPVTTWHNGVFQTSTGGITARSGNDAGTGTATLYYLSTGGTLTQHSTVTHTIKNMTTLTVGSGGKYIQAKMDVFGTWWADVEACT